MAKKKKKPRSNAIKTSIAVNKELKNPSRKSSPGVEARAANIRRTGQAIPVVTKGKPDKRTPTQIVGDRRRKRFANRKRGK